MFSVSFPPCTLVKGPRHPDSQAFPPIFQCTRCIAYRAPVPWPVIFSFSPMPDDLHFMQLALAEARASAEAGEVPIGALLVHEGAMLARSGNRTIRDNDPTAHAEI